MKVNRTSLPFYFFVCIVGILVLAIVFWFLGLSQFFFENPNPPYPPSTFFKGLSLDWKSHIRLAPGSDNWPSTWGKDDHIYTSWGDGGGFGGTGSIARVSLGVGRIEGEWPNIQTVNIWGGMAAKQPAQFPGKSYGILSIEGDLYLWVNPDDKKVLYFGSRLYRSRDLGLHWEAADWEFKKELRLTTPTFLQFGRDYEGARDGFVYCYVTNLTEKSPWGPKRKLAVQKPGEIFLMRVLKEKVMEKDQYEFFKGLNEQGEPIWTYSFDEKNPCFIDPNGVGWNLSVVFHPKYQKYLLTTEHLKSFNSNFGLFEADQPWGPWSTVSYQQAFANGVIEQSVFLWHFPSKWLSKDSGEFTMVFTGINSNDSWNSVHGRFLLHK